MRAHDVDAVEGLTGRAFPSAGQSGTSGRTPEQRLRWTDRLHHLLDTDPDGCWVADQDGAVLGVAAATRRDLLWVLNTYAVEPGRQGLGTGRALLQAAIGYGSGCLRGLICSTADPRAARIYRQAGFTLHPTMQLTGPVDRSALPVVDGVRVGSDSDLDLVDSVDRRVRGATHRADHVFLRQHGTLLVCDLLTGGGYAFVDAGQVILLAATNRAIAQRLLWSALAFGDGDATVRTLTADQEWAIDVGLAAGLQVEHDAYLALRHMRPPAPYVPSVAFG